MVILRNHDRDRRPTTIVRHLLRRANSRISSLTLFCTLAGSENWMVREVAGSPAFSSLARAQVKMGSALFLAATIHCCCSVLSSASSRLSLAGSSAPPNSSNIGGNGGRKWARHNLNPRRPLNTLATYSTADFDDEDSSTTTSNRLLAVFRLVAPLVRVGRDGRAI